MENIDKILNDALEKALKERGHINILIAGRSGVGKSTLINSVFQSSIAETGQGKPVTKNTREITK
ncbi:50S ribosome-binding GTPase, partial [Escherichia coli]|nr:50S ribosome-binding GTPase [Escherichia coli]